MKDSYKTPPPHRKMCSIRQFGKMDFIYLQRTAIVETYCKQLSQTGPCQVQTHNKPRCGTRLRCLRSSFSCIQSFFRLCKSKWGGLREPRVQLENGCNAGKCTRTERSRSSGRYVHWKHWQMSQVRHGYRPNLMLTLHYRRKITIFYLYSKFSPGKPVQIDYKLFSQIQRETNFMRKPGKHPFNKNPLTLNKKPFEFFFMTGRNKH